MSIFAKFKSLFSKRSVSVATETPIALGQTKYSGKGRPRTTDIGYVKKTTKPVKVAQRDMTINSAIPDQAIGNRTRTVNQMIANIAINAGGFVSVDEVYRIVKQDYGYDWNELKDYRPISLIKLFNKLYPNEAMLETLPKPKAGHKRTYRITHVRYIGSKAVKKAIKA